MCSTPASSGRHRNAEPAADRRLRALRIALDSPSRLLRTAQPALCPDCGNLIHWYTRPDQQPIDLHPQELDATAVPASCHWHVHSGIAHPASDGTDWCRITHRTLCPARENTAPPTPQLAALRRRLALRTRRLIDTGVFAPPPPCRPPVTRTTVCRPDRPVGQILYSRYLATCPVDSIQCVAQTRRRDRCPHPVLTPDRLAGIWALLTVTTGRGRLALPHSEMAVYDLTDLSPAEQMRWRNQQCPAHATTPTAAHLALADWEVFDPLLHYQHIRTRLPGAARHRRGKP